MKKYPEICLNGDEVVDLSIFDSSNTFASNDPEGCQFGGARYGTVIVNAVMEIDEFCKLGYTDNDVLDWNAAINGNPVYPEETKEYLMARKNIDEDHIIFPIITYGYNNYCIPMIEEDSFEHEYVDPNVREYMRSIYKMGREDVYHAMLITDYSFSPFAPLREESKYFADHLKDIIMFGLQQYCDYVGVVVEPGDYLAQNLAVIGFKKLNQNSSIYTALMNDESKD